MSDSLDPRDEAVVARLHALGDQPIDPALQSAHLTAMAGVRRESVFARSLGGRLKVAAGVLGGFLLGASGLTTVGAMGPLQPIAATAVEAVAPIDVPKGAKDKAEEAKEKADNASRLADGSIGTQRKWDGCVPGEDGKYAGNRGQYLKQERAKGDAALAAAKASECGKPVADDDDSDGTKTEATENETKSADAQNDGAGKSDDDHGKATAPGQTGDKPDDQGDNGNGNGKSGEDHGKPADAGSQPDSAGKSGIDPSDPETPAEPTTPAPEAEQS
jgi:hypothetical protein